MSAIMYFGTWYFCRIFYACCFIINGFLNPLKFLFLHIFFPWKMLATRMKNRSAVSRLLYFFYWVLFCWEMLVSVVHGGLNIEMVRNLSYYEFYVLFQQKSISPKRSAKRVFDCSCRKWRFDLNTDKGNLLFYEELVSISSKTYLWDLKLLINIWYKILTT